MLMQCLEVGHSLAVRGLGGVSSCGTRDGYIPVSSVAASLRPMALQEETPPRPRHGIEWASGWSIVLNESCLEQDGLMLLELER